MIMSRKLIRRRMMLSESGSVFDGIVYAKGDAAFKEPFIYTAVYSSSSTSASPYLFFLNPNYAENGITLMGTADSGGDGIVTIGPVNFTGFNSLNFKCDAGSGNMSSNLVVGYTDTPVTKNGDAIKMLQSQKTTSWKESTLTFDVSNVTGEYYVCACWTEYASIYDIWLEGDSISSGSEGSDENEDGDGTNSGDEEGGIYSITRSLENVTSTMNITSIDSGSSYAEMFYANDGYELSSITVLMGGADITDKVLLYGVNGISISEVTGNLVITVVAAKTDTGDGNNTEETSEILYIYKQGDNNLLEEKYTAKREEEGLLYSPYYTSDGYIGTYSRGSNMSSAFWVGEIDGSGYNTLVIDANGGQVKTHTVYVGYGTGAGAENPDSDSSWINYTSFEVNGVLNLGTEFEEYKFDISNVDNPFYVKVYASGGVNTGGDAFRIRNIWLERTTSSDENEEDN